MRSTCDLRKALLARVEWREAPRGFGQQPGLTPVLRRIFQESVVSDHGEAIVILADSEAIRLNFGFRV